MPQIVQIITTIPDRVKGEEIGRELIKQELVACCQIAGPIRSIYRWKGRVEEADEWYCIMKTTEALYSRAEEAIRSLHPYEVPEIIAIPVSHALPAYTAWVTNETI
jgi:periplasmic divalent cation tolerance protein